MMVEILMWGFVALALICAAISPFINPETDMQALRNNSDYERMLSRQKYGQ